METAAQAMAKHQQHVDRDKAEATDEFVDDCIRIFGFGDRPDIRERWFNRMRDTIRELGPKPMMIAKKLRRNARNKKNPGRYFVTCITSAFEQNGWW